MSGHHVAVIGGGGWSPVHLAALTESPFVDRVTLAARRPSQLAQRAAEFPIVRATCTDWRQVLDDPSVDWVHVVVPHELHAQISQAALAAGKHVVCEKPASTRLADFDRVADLAQRVGRRFLVVMNQLYNPALQVARQWIDEGKLGRPFLSVENAYSHHSAHYHDPGAWRTSLAGAGGGVLIDGGFHLVYKHLYLLASCGWPAWVTAETAQLNIDPRGAPVPAKGEDFVSLTVGYPGGLRIQWSHAWTLAATPTRWHQSFVAGTEATLQWTDRPEQPLELCRRAMRATDPEPVPVPLGPQSGRETTHLALLDLVEALSTNRPPRVGNLELARRTLELILTAYGAPASSRRALGT